MALDKVNKITQGVEQMVSVDDFIDTLAGEYMVSREIVDKIWWTCFNTFLTREILRHENDITRGQQEVDYLTKKGYDRLYIPASFWIDMPH